MRHIRKWIWLAAGQGALLLALGVGVPPAQAGPITHFVVDDDSAQCSTSIRRIQDAVAMAEAVGGIYSKTITVCAGTYHEQIQVSGIQNLVLHGEPGAVIMPPASPATGSILLVQGSTNVTVSNLTFDGGRSLSAGNELYAVEYDNTTGQLTGNTVTGWQRPDLSGPLSSTVSSIYVTDDQPYLGMVDVDANTVSDFQDTAIFADGDVEVNVRNNTINDTNSRVEPISTFGIDIGGLGFGTTITGNTLNGAYPRGTRSYGIVLANTNWVLVQNNLVIGWATGIWVEADQCVDTMPTEYNTVIYNEIDDADVGIDVVAQALHPACDVHNDDNQFNNNTIWTKHGGTAGIEFGPYDGTPTVAPFAATLHEIARYNTITDYRYPIYQNTHDGAVSGLFSPNTIVP